jgi:hypothetical protein
MMVSVARCPLPTACARCELGALKGYADEEVETGKVFGIPLRESLRTASVQISTANQDGCAHIQHGNDN